MIQAATICLARFVKIVLLGVKFLGDAFKIVRLELTLRNICSSILTRACWLILITILVKILGLEGMISNIFLLCFIWALYQSFINSNNWNNFFTRFIADRFNNIIYIIIMNILIFIILFIVYWDISSFEFLAFWLYMNSEMLSGEGSGTSSAGGSATGGMPPDNNPGGGGGGIPPGHGPGHNQSGNNVDENNQNNQQNNKNNQQVNTNIDPYERGQDLFVLDTLDSYMNQYAYENPQGGPHGGESE